MIKKLFKSIFFNIINNAIIIILLKKIKKRIKFKESKITLVVFSKDRPFQLRSFLLSIFKNFYGLTRVIIIYNASDDTVLSRYKKLKATFSNENICFYKESTKFKKNLNKVLSNIKTSHILFSVDDILVFEKIRLKDFQYIINDNNIFSLRLGSNIKFCYMMNDHQNLPNNYIHNKNNIISWKISDAKYDFAYPFSLDMHVFPTNLIKLMSRCLFFTSVNSFEGSLNKITKYVSNWFIYSFYTSKCINLPFNKVQNENNNKYGGQVSNILNKDFDDDKYFNFDEIKIKDIYSPHQILEVPKQKLNFKINKILK